MLCDCVDVHFRKERSQLISLESHIKDLGTGTRQDGIPFSLVSLVIGDSHRPVKFSLRKEPLRNEWACRLRTRRLGLDQQPVNDANHDLATSAAARIVTSCTTRIQALTRILNSSTNAGPRTCPWQSTNRKSRGLVEVDSRLSKSTAARLQFPSPCRHPSG